MADWPEHIVEEHSSRITLLRGESEPRGDANVITSEETYRRYYNGYICPWCHQMLTTAFERTCRSWCRGGDREYTVDEWHRFMDGEFDGYSWVGPSKETVERLEARPAKSTEIWLPPGAKE